MRERAAVIPFLLITLAGCNPIRGDLADFESTKSSTLIEARKGFVTQLSRKERDNAPPPAPPAGVFDLIKYQGPLGPMSAYVSPNPNDSRRRPAVVWITGGDCSAIGEACWEPQPFENDQSAAQLRQAGIVLMFPSLRGGNDSPGFKEGYLGEVDDILAAADHLAKLDYVDPARIYLGGHSTGGTTAMVVAACSDRFRAVFAFGPVHVTLLYGAEYCPYKLDVPMETKLRSPAYWLHCIKTPTFVIEGVGGNSDALLEMAKITDNQKILFVNALGADHFSVLAPMLHLIAAKINADNGPTCNIDLTERDIARALAMIGRR